MKVSWEIRFGGKQRVIFLFIWGMLKNVECLNVEIMQSIWIYTEEGTVGGAEFAESWKR